MRVIVTGGTGFIGSRLCGALAQDGHSVAVLSRNPRSAQRRLPAGVEAVPWQTDQDSTWQRVVDGADAVVNLAGESIAAKRWSPSQKAAIRDSRINGTRSLVEAIEATDRRPSVLVNASATGYYGPRGAEPVDESSPPGQDFLGVVCQEWESEARKAEDLGVRVALVRTGVVIGKGGGAIEKLALPFKLFVGGPLGSGRQGFPWVHLEDVVGIYQWALTNDAVAGPVNATGPESLDNRAFCQALGRVLGRPCWAPVPAVALKLLLGEMGQALLIQGQRVLPNRTQQLGYHFKFPAAEAALRDVLR